MLFVLGLFGQITFGQTAGEKLIHGKIIVESGNVAGVSIVNLVNEKSATSDGNGDFYILVKADDLLVFSSVNLEYYRRSIEEKDLKSEVLTIKLTAKTTELDEVIVNKHPEINAVDLGISPKGIKHRTQMERRLYTAGDFKPIHLIGLLGGSLNVDALLNKINGRTAMMKKMIELEKKVNLLEKTELLFEDDYYINTLKIQAEYIKGFKYYVVENEKFTTVLKSKNKTQIELVMVELAVKYNTIISDEK
ncbi:hypothetical protein SAMN05443549_1011092 [Flavobacterium fluvii]|uniref:CarboxypepD_reg-like domain-containing protein n=2 Tax=Flavobacterium fluvii TaxID=468056 RepID=A0A1M5G4K7_9FLAO|nr:hypothetical protein SAMN05443549_1011092 [Flavobacterium fluvii]